MQIQVNIEPMSSCIKIASPCLYERALRTNPSFWASYSIPTQRLKTQEPFILKVKNMLSGYELDLGNRETFHYQPSESVAVSNLQINLNLLNPVEKKNTSEYILKALVLETISHIYPTSSWIPYIYGWLSSCSNKKRRDWGLFRDVPVKSESLDEDGIPRKDSLPTVEPVSPFRTAAPQILASTAKNLLLLDLGMTIAFATIVIPVLLEGKDSAGLSFTKEEASWFGSVIFICQPLGSVVSGAMLEPLGRKKSMMLVNIPHLIGWLLFYISETKNLLYVSAIIMGLGIGFMEAPIITYVGEISQPRLRGTLTSYANLFVTFGMMLIYFIGNFVDWRTAAAISSVVPVLTIIAISQVPETPIWLMARGRKEEAEKALCWLRGWVTPEHIKKEFQELARYTESTKLKISSNGVVNPGFVSDDGSATQEGKGFDQLTFTEKVKDLARPGMMKPLGLIVAFFFFGNFTGTTSTRPYMVLLAEEFKMPLDPYKATLVFGAIGFAGSVICMVTIAKFKKRPIALLSMFTASVSGFCLYLFSSQPWVAFVAYIVLTFASYYGANGLVWTLVSEVFPFRGRGVVSGLAAAFSYLISFLSTKTFQALQDLLTLRGTFIFYAIMSAIGTVFLYFLMPETEGRSLEDIERDYEKKPPLPQNGDKTPDVV